MEQRVNILNNSSLILTDLLKLFFINLCVYLTDNPAVPALQGGGGTGDRAVGTVPVAGLARHRRREGGAGAACGGGGGAAGQGGARADPLVLDLEKTETTLKNALLCSDNSMSAH